MSDIQIDVQLNPPNTIEVTLPPPPSTVEVRQSAPVVVEVSDVPRVSVNIPLGGNTNEVLTKSSNENFAYRWAQQSSGSAVANVALSLAANAYNQANAAYSLANNAGVGSYSDANVAAYLPNYGGEIRANNISSNDYVNLVSSNYAQLQWDPTYNYRPDDIRTGSWLYLASGGMYYESNVTGQYISVRFDELGNMTTPGDVTVDEVWTTSVNFLNDDTVQTTAFLGFATDNTAREVAVAAFEAANGAVTDFSPAFNKANAANVLAYESGVIASAAYDKANSALANTDGVVFDGSLRVLGTLHVGANSVTITENSISAASIIVGQTNVDSAIVASFNKANSSTILGGAAFDKANSSNIVAVSAFDKANSANITAVAAFDKANTANVLAVSAFTQSNTALTSSQSAYNQSNTNATTVQAAYNQANTALTTAQAVYNQSNTNGSVTQTAFAQSNAAYNQANTAYNQANSAYNTANTALSIPQNPQSTNYTLVLADQGRHIYVTSNSTITIPANSSVSFPVGATVVLVTAANITANVAINTDTLYLGGVGTTGTRQVYPYGLATLIKVTNTTWYISGAGVA